MRLVSTCAIAWLIATSSGALADSRDKTKPTCPTKGESVVAVSKLASVYVPRGGRGRWKVYRACNRRTGRSFNLVHEGNPYTDRESGSAPMLSGRYVALEIKIYPRGAAGVRNVIRAFDILEKRRVIQDEETYVKSGIPHQPELDRPLAALVVTRHGAVAWIAPRPTGDALIDVRGEALGEPLQAAAPSPSVQLDSLALNDGYVYWQDQGPHVLALKGVGG